MKEYLIFAQIIVSVVLVILILLQQRGSSLGSVFGGTGEFYTARRGMEKKILWATTIFGILFVTLALLNLLI
jgi:preprotein translocase subunit SecG